MKKKKRFNKTQRKRLASIISGGAFFLLGIIFSALKWDIPSAIAFTASGACAGAMCVTRAVSGMRRGSFFDENTLMTIAAIGAVILGEYPECAAVMILYQVGELFQSLAVGRSRKAIAELGKLCPDTAEVLRDGAFTEVSATDVAAGETLRIKPGERIPVDCMIAAGNTSVDTSPVTGESVPVDAVPGTTLYSGCMNMSGVITATALRPAEDSAAARILKLTEQASDRKTATEAFITRFAKVYTPIVCIVAALTAFAVPLILSLIGVNSFVPLFAEWSRKALSMLVISCPCALVISVPLGYFCGIGRASKAGILIKGSVFIDALAHADFAVFDKTGTLTKGKLQVSKVECKGDEAELLQLAASAEASSSHPIAKALVAAADDILESENITETAGNGIEATVAGKRIRVCKPDHDVGSTAVDVFCNGELIGTVYFADELKPDSRAALEKIKQLGIRQTVILTGDSTGEAERIKGEVGADTVHARLLPEDKLRHIEMMCAEGKVIYAGDGINDSPSLARSDVGVAMGALGTDAAIEAADIVLMDSNPMRLAEAIRLSKRTAAAVRANIALSLGVKIAVLVLALLGITGMWSAVLSDVGMCIICVSNSMRLLKIKL